jgi:CheY-like chemotaxis protein
MGFDQAKGKVLVVDDSPEMRRYLQTLLELNSYRVLAASSGIEALQLLMSGADPDVVLLDLEMPELNGFVTLERIRYLRPDLKVIMCSGMMDVACSRKAIRLGAEAFLVKPVRHLYLTAALERCIARNPVHHRAAVRPEVIPFPVTRPS